MFLRHRAPHQPPVANNHFHQVVSGCFARAGIEASGRHRGLHALRHSAAVGMLESGAAYPVIGAVLGHAEANMGFPWFCCRLGYAASAGSLYESLYSCGVI